MPKLPEPCCICGRSFFTGENYPLTEEEKRVIGTGAPESYSYCGPCLKILQNRYHGAQMMRGYIERTLRARNVPNAEKLADNFYERLLAAALRGVH